MSTSGHTGSAQAQRRSSTTRPLHSNSLTLRPTRQRPRLLGSSTSSALGCPARSTARLIWTSVIPRFVIGIDNTDLFHDVPVTEKILFSRGSSKGTDYAIPDGHRFKGKIMSYVVEPNETSLTSSSRRRRGLVLITMSESTPLRLASSSR